MNSSKHMKLLDLPVFSEVVAFLDGLYGGDLFCLGTTSKAYHDFVTHHPSMSHVWYTLLRRAMHFKIDKNSWSYYKEMQDCYTNWGEKYTYIFPSTYVNNIRQKYGECCQEEHYRKKMKGPDPVTGFRGRDLYKEWQEVMWRRKKRTYWSALDDRKIAKLHQQLFDLMDKKEFSNKLAKRYDDILKKEKKQRRSKKNNK